MKTTILATLVSCMCISSVLNAAPNTTLDLTPYLKDRFENNCAVRPDYDFHKTTEENNEILKILKNQVIKEESEEHQVYASTKYFLKNTVYHGLAVKNIKFSWGRSGTLSEFLYFDLSKASARQQFNKIKWNKNQKAKGAGLVIAKDGKFTTVQCYWDQVR